MKVIKLEIVISVVKLEQYFDGGFLEIVLVGRLNVGKLFFINLLINWKNLVRMLLKLGKIQILNFYIINDELYFVDVFGYGFVKVLKSEWEVWGRMIEIYMMICEELKVCVQIVDFRYVLFVDDVNMYEFLKYYGIFVIVIVIKVDKILKGKWDKYLKVVKQMFDMDFEDELILFFFEIKKGKDEVWGVIKKMISR